MVLSLKSTLELGTKLWIVCVVCVVCLAGQEFIGFSQSLMSWPSDVSSHKLFPVIVCTYTLENWYRPDDFIWEPFCLWNPDSPFLLMIGCNIWGRHAVFYHCCHVSASWARDNFFLLCQTCSGFFTSLLSVVHNLFIGIFTTAQIQKSKCG